MKIEPTAGRVIIEAGKGQEYSTLALFTRPITYRDIGIVINPGTVETVEVGDKVKYELKGSRDIRIDGRDLISVNEDKITAVLD